MEPTNKDILFKSDKLTFFKNGFYEINEDGLKISGNVWEYRDIVSVQFNQLKAKLYNTVEAAITDKEQKDAVKGLIKGFCNDNYKNTINDLKGLMQRMGLIIYPEGSGCQNCEPDEMSIAEPLEIRNY